MTCSNELFLGQELNVGLGGTTEVSQTASYMDYVMDIEFADALLSIGARYLSYNQG